MKLDWFSPLPPAATDIAHFTMRVLPALSQRADVTLWTVLQAGASGGASVEALSKLADIRTFDPKRVPCEDLNRADACIYNIGNNPVFHGAIWQVARRHAGIVILHDTRLHNFFDGLYRVQWRDLAGYLEVMNFYYGEEGLRDGADCYRNEAGNIKEMSERYPLTEHALENSLGVVVHTEQAFEELSKRSDPPVAYLPLPFTAPGRRDRARSSPGTPKPMSDSDDAPYRLIMFGYIGRNRRLEAVLEALHGMAERERFHLDVFGEILDNEDQIRRQIRDLGLKKLVTLDGFAPEEKLDEALLQADLAINLRNPTMGEASGSQLRIWAHALPSLVTNVGWYSTLPTDAVVHVRADENEIGDIQSALRAFVDDRARFAAMGQRGRKILEEQHSAEKYALGLVEFVEKVTHHRVHAALLNLAERTGAITSDLFGKEASDAMVSNVANEICSLTNCYPTNRDIH
ncbi:MAG TPA: glycosyltransferase [Pyrinomonadaceae bacterium]|nr:glycosyltransferase [Pyrinomonadaceae bacterium]